jgi:hypothetical protein
VLDFVRSVLDVTPDFAKEEHALRLAQMLLGQAALGAFG